MCVTHAENTFYKSFGGQKNKSKFIFVLYIAEQKDIRHKCNCVENSVCEKVTLRTYAPENLKIKKYEKVLD